MGRRPTNNPRMVASKACGCSYCTEKNRPGEKPTSREHTGSWQYRYTGPGGREESVNAASYDDAVAEGEKRKVAIRAGTYLDPSRSDITLEQWWSIWWPLQKGEPTTLDRDERMWRNHILPRFGRWKIRAMGWSEIQAWVNDLDGPLKPASIIKTFQILDRMMAAALLDKRLPYNPCDGVKMPKLRKKHPEDRRPPTYVQLRMVRRALPRYHWALQIVAQETGLRWGELAGLRACWVDLENARIQVREVLTEVRGKLARKEYPKSDAGLRSVPLTPLALRVLTMHMAAENPARTRTAVDSGMHPEELVFHGRNRVNRRGEPARAPLRRSAFRRLWISAITEAGVVRVREKKLPDGKVRKDYWPDFHDQRHSFASRLHAAGVPEVITQEILGHERAGEVTWLYTHAAADYAGQVLAALSDAESGRRLRAVPSVRNESDSSRTLARVPALSGM